jgi:hypothetical protein
MRRLPEKHSSTRVTWPAEKPRPPAVKAADPFNPSSAFLTEVGKEIKAKGMLFQVLVLGSSDARAYTKLMDLGVESFATDDQLVTLEVMREHIKKSKSK